MRDFKLILEERNEVFQVILTINESIQIYQKKINVYEKRKEFRRQDQCFELFLRRFYRNLIEDSKKIHNVLNDEIRDYWSTMWNKEQKMM